MTFFRHLQLSPIKRLCAAASVASMTLTSAASGQTTDHARIESLFQLLEPANSTALTGPASLAPKQATLLPPAPAPAPMQAIEHPESSTSSVPSVPFATVAPDGTNCPSKIEDFTEALNDLVETVESFERRIIKLSTRYDKLDEQALAFVTSGETSCSEAMRRGYKAFLESANDMSIPDDILSAENLQVCAQFTVTNLDHQITGIQRDASAADQQRRMALSQVMRMVSGLDGKATETVERLVSLEQKRQRLVIGIERFDAQCAAFEGVTFGANYN